MRWIIHIGAPKTGSTAIQRCLFDNRGLLPSHGVYYPDISLRGFGHHDLAFLLHGQYPRWATPQHRTLAELRDDLRSFLAKEVVGTIVLSSEDFYLYPKPAELRRFLLDAGAGAGDLFEIICYVRRQDEAHMSWYNQTVKAQGNSDSFADTVERSRSLWDYAAQLEPWRKVFGTQSIIVRDYSRFASSSSDIRADFIDLIGMPAGSLPLPAARVNERLNRDILDFQRLLNRLPLKPVYKRRYHKRLIDLTSRTVDRGIFSDAPFLSASERSALYAYYKDGNDHVAKTYLGQDELFAHIDHAETGGGAAVPSGLTLTKLAFILKAILFAPRPDGHA